MHASTHFEREYSIDPIGVPAFPDWSGMFAVPSALSRIGIPTVRTIYNYAGGDCDHKAVIIALHSMTACLWESTPTVLNLLLGTELGRVSLELATCSLA